MYDKRRETRLVGDGHDEMSGGGLPLPDASVAVMQALMDHGTSSTGYLTQQIVSALAYKEARIAAIWSRQRYDSDTAYPDPWLDHWDFFARDILAQLEDHLYIQGDGDKWEIGPAFNAGTSLPFAGKASFTVFGREKRKERNKHAKTRMDLVQLRARAREEGLDKEQEKLFGLLIASYDEEEPHPVKKVRPPKPSVLELAREKYGLDGGPLRGSTTVPFDETGRRRCTTCGNPKLPEEFEVYWHEGNGDYFLAGICLRCDRQRRRGRYNSENPTGEQPPRGPAKKYIPREVLNKSVPSQPVFVRDYVAANPGPFSAVDLFNEYVVRYKAEMEELPVGSGSIRRTLAILTEEGVLERLPKIKGNHRYYLYQKT